MKVHYIWNFGNSLIIVHTSNKACAWVGKMSAGPCKLKRWCCAQWLTLHVGWEEEGVKMWKLNYPWTHRSIWETLASASDCETGARGQQLTGLNFSIQPSWRAASEGPPLLSRALSPSPHVSKTVWCSKDVISDEVLSYFYILDVWTLYFCCVVVWARSIG